MGTTEKRREEVHLAEMSPVQMTFPEDPVTRPEQLSSIPENPRTPGPRTQLGWCRCACSF